MDRFNLEIDSLLRELSESEATALQAGEVDAVFDRGTATPLLLRQAQEALRRREQEFRELVEHAPDRIVRLDRDLRYLYANPAFERLLKIESGSAVGAKSCDLGVPGEVASVFEAACERAFETARMQTVDLEWQGAAAQLYFSARIAPELGASGDVLTVLAIVRDVTEQKLAEAALRKSELLFRSLTERGDDMIIVLDREGGVQYASPSVERHLGYPLRSVLGREALDLVHEDDLPAIRAGLEHRAGVPGVGSTVRCRVRHQDGSWRVIEAVASNQFDDHGISGMVINAREITRRAEAEEALRASEERLQRILETVTDAITIIHRDGRITYANAAAEQVLGLERRGITGRLYNAAEWKVSAIDGGDYPDEELAFQRVMRTGQPAYGMEHAIQHPDGSRVILSVNAAPLLSASQEVVGVIAAIRNVTEERRAQEAVRYRERYFRSLIEASSDVISILDQEGTIIYESPSIERVLGYTPEEMVGQNALGLIHPEDLPRIQTAFEKGVEDPKRQTSIQYRFLHKNGSWCELESTATNQLQDPAIGGMVINSRDVTERKKLEEQLLQAQKLEAVGRLAGGIAHDFNNLLQVIGGNARLLAMGEVDPAETAAELSEIEHAVARAAALTQQLLTFSRRQVSRPEVLSMHEELHRMSALLRRLVGEDIEIVSLLGASECCVQMDRSQLDQIVLNLAVNARDSMAEGGRLFISLEEVELSNADLMDRGASAEPGSYVVLRVTDTGPGIQPETIPLIFEPFFSTKPQSQGTGLGLSTVYGIVQEAGGFIEVDSVPHEETSFSIYLPAVIASQLPDGAAAAAEDEGSGELVLVVDDDAKVRRVVCRMLERFNYRTIEASNGEEGTRMAEARAAEISLVITDVVMPLMGGRELAQWMSEHLPEIPVLFISGYMDDGGDGLPLDAKGRGFIAKPLRQEALRQRVHELIGRAREEGIR